LVDRSFATRQPRYCAAVRRLFGDESIRCTRTHAKVALLKNDGWAVTVRSSFHLQLNAKLRACSEVPLHFGLRGHGVPWISERIFTSLRICIHSPSPHERECGWKQQLSMIPASCIRTLPHCMAEESSSDYGPG